MIGLVFLGLVPTHRTCLFIFDALFGLCRISDQVLTECLKEIENELADVEENIVHQVCKSEFAIPEIPAQKQEEDEVANYDYPPNIDPVSSYKLENLRTSQENYEDTNIRSSLRDNEDMPASAVRESVDKSLVQSSIDTGRSRENGASSKKEVTFDDREISYEREVSYERESSYEREESFEHGAIFDAADLDAAIDERDPPKHMYQDDLEEDDDDEEDEISEVSPIDSDDLEYSTDET